MFNSINKLLNKLPKDEPLNSNEVLHNWDRESELEAVELLSETEAVHTLGELFALHRLAHKFKERKGIKEQSTDSPAPVVH